MMKLRNLGDGIYAIGDSGWTVRKDTYSSTNIWTVFDRGGKEQIYRTSRKEAVEIAWGLIQERQQ